MAEPISVRQAGADDAARIAPLFDRYRQFYGKPPAPALALDFVTERLAKGQSTIFLGEEQSGTLLGFTQLYPSFTSIRAAPTFILNDLFVEERARGRGVARRLVEAAEEFARSCGAPTMSLATARTNSAAQQLYERMGWQQDNAFFVYTRSLEL